MSQEKMTSKEPVMCQKCGRRTLRKNLKRHCKLYHNMQHGALSGGLPPANPFCRNWKKHFDEPGFYCTEEHEGRIIDDYSEASDCSSVVDSERGGTVVKDVRVGSNRLCDKKYEEEKEIPQQKSQPQQSFKNYNTFTDDDIDYGLEVEPSDSISVAYESQQPAVCSKQRYEQFFQQPDPVPINGSLQLRDLND